MRRTFSAQTCLEHLQARTQDVVTKSMLAKGGKRKAANTEGMGKTWWKKSIEWLDKKSDASRIRTCALKEEQIVVEVESRTSLWLVPDPDGDAIKLSRIMDEEITTVKSPSSFPHFHPHITLTTVPSTTSESVLRDAVKPSQPTVPIRFQSLDVGNKYFMSVYVTVHRTPELVALRDHLSNVLGEKTVPPIPHMSLYYIDDPDAADRQKVADILQRDRVIDGPDGSSVRLDCTEGDERGVDVLDGFVGHEIWIMLCDGPVDTWKRIGEPITL
ncbi:cyclic phosphodiesterase-like protein-domain-containing protein [Cristinia sonorae]|uniref:Cyclic phosphodiesterase-like protein-domain-containing protein n=1 Tax=Cristinia sonorae TaxID=1940300 RepID=A0A8K0XU20_9AGAR|nr:cyclic phosphodiesterase-like protein-domain-containing protein [Cristinia sonorae]